MALTAATRLRALLGERIPNGLDSSDTFFSDTEINDLIDEAGSRGLTFAAAVGWTWKMAEFARLIDVNESGSDRKYRQKYINAKQQAEYFQAQADATAAQIMTSARVVGKSVPWARPWTDEFPRVLFTPPSDASTG